MPAGVVRGESRMVDGGSEKKDAAVRKQSEYRSELDQILNLSVYPAPLHSAKVQLLYNI